jgi:hypothetical protein
MLSIPSLCARMGVQVVSLIFCLTFSLTLISFMFHHFMCFYVNTMLSISLHARMGVQVLSQIFCLTVSLSLISFMSYQFMCFYVNMMFDSFAVIHLAYMCSGSLSWEQLLRYARLRKEYVSLYASLLKSDMSRLVVDDHEEIKRLDRELDIEVILQWR